MTRLRQPLFDGTSPLELAGSHTASPMVGREWLTMAVLLSEASRMLLDTKVSPLQVGDLIRWWMRHTATLKPYR